MIILNNKMSATQEIDEMSLVQEEEYIPMSSIPEIDAILRDPFMMDKNEKILGEIRKYINDTIEVMGVQLTQEQFDKILEYKYKCDKCEKEEGVKKEHFGDNTMCLICKCTLCKNCSKIDNEKLVCKDGCANSKKIIEKKEREEYEKLVGEESNENQ